MRIIHFSCVAPPEVGGIGRVAHREVASLAERGFDAHHVSLTTHSGFRFDNAGTVHAPEHLVREADIVHLHYPFYGTQGALVRLRRQGKIKKLVMTLHMDAAAGGLKGLVFDAHRRLFQPRLLPVADALIISSCDYALHSSYRGWAEQAIELPFGVDENIFYPGASARFAFGLAENLPTVLFVGGMDKAHAFKGVEVLLQALARIQISQALLVGDGDLRRSYEARAQALGIEERCKFVGMLDEGRLVQAYRSSDMLVLPSVSGAEAFGLVALEAEACGLPVIASALPGVRTVVAHEETGLLVPPSDAAALAEAISRLFRDAEARRRMGARARQRVLEQFTWTRHMDGLEEVYKKICASPS